MRHLKLYEIIESYHFWWKYWTYRKI